METLACPKCGAPLQAGSADSLTRCPQCGSAIRITRNAAGQLVGVVDEATEIVARRTAIEALEQRLAKLAAERQKLAREMSAPLEQLEKDISTARMHGCIVFGILAAVVVVMWVPNAFLVPPFLSSLGPEATGPEFEWYRGSGLYVCGAALCLVQAVGIPLLAILGVTRFGRGHRLAATRAQARAEVEQRAEEQRPAIARLDEEIASTEERIATLKQELQDLAGRL